MKLNILAIPTVWTIIITIVILLVLAGLSVLLFYSIRKEYQKNKYEKSLIIAGLISKAAINNVVSSYIYRATNDTRFALFYIDIDDFSNIEKAFGSPETKRIIETLIGRIKDVIPREAKIGKLGESEFLVFLPYDYSRVQAHELVKKVKREINRSIDIYGADEISIGASISLAHYPFDGNDYKSILRSLKLTNYIIKRQGGNIIKAYSEEFERTDENEQLEYYYEIRRAIENKEFILYYTPVLNINTGKIKSLEGTLRWEHPEHGVLGASKFINILEQSGDIYWVGLWNLGEIIELYNKVNVDREEKIKVVLKLGAKQMINENLTTDFVKTIKKYRFDPSNIILSIGEFALFDKNEVIIKNMEKLKEIGFQLLMGEFGIDYSTLSQLEKFNIDIIEFNAQFLDEDITNKEDILQLLLKLAKSKKIDVVAEKVETHTIVERLKNNHVEFATGRYYTEPLNDEKIVEYLTIR